MILRTIMWLAGVAISVAVGFYLRPPQITPVSEDYCLNLRRIEGIRGEHP